MGKFRATERGYLGAGFGIVEAGDMLPDHYVGPCPPWAEEIDAAGEPVKEEPGPEMTKNEIMAKLDEMEIEYNGRDKKEVLLALLQAEVAKLGGGTPDQPNEADAATIDAIQQVTVIQDLYKFQAPGRSAAIDNAINKRGMELMKQAADAAPPAQAPQADLSAGAKEEPQP